MLIGSMKSKEVHLRGNYINYIEEVQQMNLIYTLWAYVVKVKFLIVAQHYEVHVYIVIMCFWRCGRLEIVWTS